LLLAGCVLAAGCAAPFGVRRASPEVVHRTLTANVVSTGELSNTTEIVLRRQSLTDLYAFDPATTLGILRTRLLAGDLPADNLYALAELSFHCAANGGGKPYYLASAVYAYAFLFPTDPQAAPDPIDPRLNAAAALYDRALTEAFRSADGESVEVAAGTYSLPWGQIAIGFDDQQLRWGDRRLVNLFPAEDVEVVGFRNRYRQPGIGVPLAAATQPLGPVNPALPFIVGKHVRVPVTLLLRVPDPRQQVLVEQLTGQLELRPATVAMTTDIDARSVPLAQEPTVALALALNASQPWKADLGRFFGSILQTDVTGASLGAREPHWRGRIPVVLVHGTASNFSVWANLVNDLDPDPVIREHFEFWFFGYDSGQPILYSGMQLRRALTAAVQAFQAVAPDPCLDDMVVIGHSQGGLLTKLTAINSGDQFWRNLSDEPIDEVRMPEESRALLKEAMFIEPLPFVRRVVFIATPQHGSYLAGPNLVRRLGQWLISLPASLARSATGLLTSDANRKMRLQSLPTSIDNMAPGNPFIVTIAKIPVAPGVTAHSIIGITDSGPLDEDGDGVVKYRSAHIDGVESELIVRSEHSMQSKADVIAEVQRILHEHLEQDPCSAPNPTVAKL
jgi:pimeloyl-ACP methyl ester carboxylesterase